MDKKTKAINQRQLVSEAKLRVRGISKEIADLKRESYYLQWFIENSDHISATRKSNLTEKWKTKLKRGQSHKKSKLKAAINFL